MNLTTQPLEGQAKPPSADPGEGERLHRVSALTRALRRPELGSVLAALAIFAMFAGFDGTPNHVWLQQAGFASWLQQAAIFGIMSVPVGLLMIGGEFDLSTGVMTGFSAIIIAVLVVNVHMDVWFAIAITFVFAGFVGLINGLLVVKTKLPSFVVTLGTFFVLRGISIGGVELLTNGNTVVAVTSGTPAGMGSAQTVFGSSFLSSNALPSGYSTSILWFIAVTVVASWVLMRTRFGNWIFAAGGDQNAARNVGVPVNRTKILLFMSTALAAALVGAISFTQASSAVSEEGVGYELYYIIAAVVGGCLLTGGYGSAFGAAIGACIIGMGFEGVIYAGWNSAWDFTFLGVILLLAVVINTFIYRRASTARR